MAPAVADPVPGSRRLRLHEVAIVVVTVVLAVSASTTAHAQDQSDLERAEDQIAEIESELASANAASEDARADLARAREALDRIEAVVNAVAQRVDRQEEVVGAARAALADVEARQDAAVVSIRRKAVELYKHAGGGELATLMDARDIDAAIDRSAFLRLVDRTDTARLEDLDAIARRRTAAADLLDRESAALDDLLARQEAVMAAADRARESRALAAAAAEDEVDELEAEHEHLSDLAVEIEQAIAEREAAEQAAREAAAAAAAAAAPHEASGAPDDDGGDSASPPPVSGGGYAWPLCGTVTSEFKWRWGRQHEGLDIDDDRTDRITAAQSGTVISAGYNSGGYGNLVLVQHADGVVTAYAHQRAIAVGTGQSVGRGELIGWVGSTGNSTGPHLHFETRVDGTNPVDPRQFLSGGC